MSTWKTTETRTETVDREWRLTVTNEANGLPRRSDEGGYRPLPADYIAALRSESVEVRAEVVCELYGRPYEEACLDRDQARADLATVTAELESERAVRQTLTWLLRDRANIRAAMTRAQELFGGDGIFNAAGFSNAAASLSGNRGAILDGHWVYGLLHGHAACLEPRGAHYRPLSELPPDETELLEWERDGAQKDRDQARADLATVTAERDALRAQIAGLLPEARIDRETMAVLALVEWTRLHDSRYLCGLKKGGIEIRDWFMESSETTALALCARLGIEVPE